MKYIQHYLGGLILLLCLAFATGCTSEEYRGGNKGDGGYSEVTFRFRLPGEKLGTRAMNPGAEQDIRTLDVLVFRKVSGQEIFDYRFTVNPSSITTTNNRMQFTTSVRFSVDPQRFVFIANAADEVNPLSGAGQLKEDVLKALVFRNPGKWKSATDDYTPIPMWGETDLSVVNNSGELLPVTLYRMLAKIDIKMTGTASEKFRLREVYLFNRNLQGRIVPDATNWSMEGGGMPTSATLPADPQTEQTPAGLWHYDSTDGITEDTVTDIIYTFETKTNSNGVPTDQFALVVGGSYQNNPTSYYRVDFKDDTNTNYVDLLRNYRYEVEVTDVTSAGSSTPGDAFQGGITLEATVTAWNEANQHAIIDGPNTLELDSTVALLNYRGGLLVFNVNSSSPNEWVIERSELIADVTATKMSAGEIHIQGSSILNTSLTEERDCGWIDIRVDNLQYRLKVVAGVNPECYPPLHKGWAGSNIYAVWDETTSSYKLTFDDVGDTTHEKYQGLFFQWGSLWGLDPSGYGDNAPWNNKFVYKPDGSRQAGVAWNDGSIPRIPDIDIANTPPPGKELVDRQYLIEIHDPDNGVGDICKYITDKGWAPGAGEGKKWRMPTMSEFGVAGDYTNNTLDSQPLDSADDQGKSPVLKGYWKNGVPFFPVAGYRRYEEGLLNGVSFFGYYWAASLNGKNGCYAGFQSFGMGVTMSPNGMFRVHGFSVRCVQE